LMTMLHQQMNTLWGKGNPIFRPGGLQWKSNAKRLGLRLNKESFFLRDVYRIFHGLKRRV